MSLKFHFSFTTEVGSKTTMVDAYPKNEAAFPVIKIANNQVLLPVFESSFAASAADVRPTLQRGVTFVVTAQLYEGCWRFLEIGQTPQGPARYAFANRR